MSGMGIYSSSDDPWHAYTETDPIGRGATAYAPTSPASKLGVESVARFCARAFDLPVVITRLNTFMGSPASFPGMHITAVLEGQPMIAPTDPNPHSPIHTLDMQDQLEALLDAASTTACITNWCGDDAVTAQEWMAMASEWSGKPGTLVIKEAPGSPAGTLADPTRRRSITGPCKTNFKDQYRKLYDEMTGHQP
jgi:UDP-glucuronate 4-epimerase